MVLSSGVHVIAAEIHGRKPIMAVDLVWHLSIKFLERVASYGCIRLVLATIVECTNLITELLEARCGSCSFVSFRKKKIKHRKKKKKKKRD